MNAIDQLPSALKAAVLAGEPAADLWPHLMDASAKAQSAGARLYLPPGLWYCRPDDTATITGWRGDVGATRLLVDTANFAGASLEEEPILRIVDSTALAGLVIQEHGTGQACLLRVEGRTLVGERVFTGRVHLRDLVISGFARQVELGNTFFVSAKRCDFINAAQAVRCAPAHEDGDTGYFTTHLWEQCSWRDNGQHIQYAPALKGTCLMFQQCEAGAATDATVPRVQLANITAVQAFSFYAEHSPTVPGIDFGTCSQVDWIGGRASGTGGVVLGTNCQLSMRGVQLVESTDTITGGNWTNSLELAGVEAPAAGNSAWSDFGHFSARDTRYGGTYYADFAGNRAAGFSEETFADDVTFNLRFGSAQRLRLTDARPVRLHAPVNACRGTVLNLQIENRCAGDHGPLQWGPAFRVAPVAVPPGLVGTLTLISDGLQWTQQGALGLVPLSPAP
jgi:hypothetical protein